jgi:hypothetical protein
MRMSTITRRAALLGAALLLAGCAGTKFVRPAEGDLSLGKTSPEQAMAMLGKPYQEATGLTNGKSTRTLGYAYASMGAEPKNRGVTPVHGLTLVFHEDKLVSKAYLSNLKADATDFDDTQVPRLQVGKSTAADVVKLLGQPSGEAIYPAVKLPEGRAMLYTYQEMRGFTPSTKELIVVLDGRGTVADMEFKNQGTWGK